MMSDAEFNASLMTMLHALDQNYADHLHNYFWTEPSVYDSALILTLMILILAILKSKQEDRAYSADIDDFHVLIST